MDLSEFTTAMHERATESRSSANHETWTHIGQALGSTDDDWVHDSTTLDALFECLGAYAGVQDLLSELSQGISGENDYTEWIAAAYLAVRFSAADRFTDAEYDENYGMNYRYDTFYEVYEWEDPDTPDRWMDGEEADALRQRTIADAEPDADAETETETDGGYSDPVYDENYEMWYRYDHTNGVYEWADTEHAAEDEWLSQAEVDARYAEQEPADEPVELTEADTRFVAEFADAMEPVLAEAIRAVPDAQFLSDEEIRQVLADALGVDR